MGVKTIRTCDSCGRTESKRVTVLGLDQKWTDGTRTTGDLCTDCRSDMAKRYGLEHTTRRRRHTFKVTEIGEDGLPIPDGK